jgi:hypothetical protein
MYQAPCVPQPGMPVLQASVSSASPSEPKHRVEIVAPASVSLMAVRVPE